MDVTASDDVVEDSDDSGVFERLLPEMSVDSAYNSADEEEARRKPLGEDRGKKVGLPSRRSKKPSNKQPDCSPKKKYYDVFISYRRANGDHMAANIKARLANRNYSVRLNYSNFSTMCRLKNEKMWA